MYTYIYTSSVCWDSHNTQFPAYASIVYVNMITNEVTNTNSVAINTIMIKMDYK